MKKPPDFKTKIGGKTWSVFFVRRNHPKVKGCWGQCFGEDREIYVRYDLAKSTVRDCLIHEMFHASNDLLYESEWWVTRTASEINAGIDKAGL
jgi:hypothetical protein